MYISKKQFDNIRGKYGSLIADDNDVVDALMLVQDLLEAEAEAIKAVEPEAIAAIARLKEAAYEVFSVQSDVENEEFLEQDGDLPKCVSIAISELALDGDVFYYNKDGSFYCDKYALTEIVEDFLSDTYGYCHFGFHWEFAYCDGKVAEIVVTDIQWDVDKEEELTVVRTMDELKEYLEENGWWVSECNFSGGHVGWEIGKHSPAGEDFFFSFEHDNDVESAVKGIKDYAYDFDEDEHIEMNIEARRNGLAGVPDTKTLVEDAKAIQEMLDELADGVNWCEQETIRETCASLNSVIEEAEGRAKAEPSADRGASELER